MLEGIIVSRLVKSVQMPFSIKGDPQRRCVNVRTIGDADETSLVWVAPANRQKQFFVDTTPASIIVCDDSIDVTNLLERKTFIIVKEPRLAFLRIVRQFFTPQPLTGIHPTAFIHPEAKIGVDCYIGPFTYIGQSKIGDACQIMGHVFIYDGVEMGSRVIIHAGTVIGADGFGYQRNERGELEKFPHLGGIVIEDNVEIGANTCIDRGVLGNTLIRRGTKIDNLVHIAHNVIIGEDAAVIAHAMIGGSTQLGNKSWIAPSACLRDGLHIGESAVVGLGAVVVKDVETNTIVLGVPAKPIN